MGGSSKNHNKFFRLSDLELQRSGDALYYYRGGQEDTALHSHGFVEIVLVAEGSATHEVDGSKRKLQRGDLFAILPGSSHRYMDAADFKIAQFVVRNGFLEELPSFVRNMRGFRALFVQGLGSRRRPPLSDAALAECLSLMELVKAEIWNGRDGGTDMVKSLLLEFIVKVCRLSESGDSCALWDWADFGGLSFYIDSHMKEPASIDEMAKVCGVSSRTLLRRFKAQTGLSPMEFLNRTRLERAARMLREGCAGIKDIALDCGFCDGNYFSKQFKKSFGLSPRAFRQGR